MPACAPRPRAAPLPRGAAALADVAAALARALCGATAAGGADAALLGHAQQRLAPALRRLGDAQGAAALAAAFA